MAAFSHCRCRCTDHTGDFRVTTLNPKSKMRSDSGWTIIEKPVRMDTRTDLRETDLQSLSAFESYADQNCLHIRGADPGMPGIGRLAPRLETIPRASVFLAIYTEPCQVPCRHSSSIPTNRPLGASQHDLAARRTKSVTVRAAYARSRRRACPPPRRHQTRIFQAPSAARRPRARPLRPDQHPNRPRCDLRRPGTRHIFARP